MTHKDKGSSVPYALPRIPGHLPFSNEGVIGPLVLVFVAGSMDGQRNSPFPMEQEQQPIYR